MEPFAAFVLRIIRIYPKSFCGRGRLAEYALSARSDCSCAALCRNEQRFKIRADVPLQPAPRTERGDARLKETPIRHVCKVCQTDTLASHEPGPEFFVRNLVQVGSEDHEISVRLVCYVALRGRRRGHEYVVHGMHGATCTLRQLCGADERRLRMRSQRSMGEWRRGASSSVGSSTICSICAVDHPAAASFSTVSLSLCRPNGFRRAITPRSASVRGSSSKWLGAAAADRRHRLSICF